ncbi:MAG: polysaccharide deacetylase family protein [Planctomycetaceae bacterium]|nr:polysaccharide deacetylase family protein [Planctomycetaceae bacterium]
MNAESLNTSGVSRRAFLSAMAAGAGVSLVPGAQTGKADEPASDNRKAQIAITLDLEMSRHYPRRGMMEWDFQKGNLDDATKQYAVEAARIVQERGGVIHFFCVGRVLEQADVGWLKEIAAAGHPIGNHTYDHVYVLAKTREEIQFRFQRAPWLIEGREIDDVIRENIRTTTLALQERAGVAESGFRTPGGFADGLAGREDVQQMLLDLGYPWVSSKYPRHDAGEPMQEPSAAVYADIVRAQAEAQPFVYPTGLVEVPMNPISDVNAFRTNFWKLPYFLKAVRQAAEWAIERRAVFDFLAHPSCLVVEDPRFETIKLLCDLTEQSNGRAEIVGLDRIAERITPQ